jgi:predicted MFS family arabinose efflux permease
MPGLKVITDRLPSLPHPRLVAFYTTSFSIGSSLSFYWIGQLVETMSWRRAIVTIAIGPAMAWALVFLMIRPRPIATAAAPTEHGRWRDVARSADAMRYIVGYACHTWELFGLRAWLVPFLTFCVVLQGGGTFASPQTLAAIVGLIGVPASLAGAELSARVNRRTLIVTVMMLSSASSFAFGLSSMTNWTLILIAALFYSAIVSADSAALTSGLVAVAPPESRGTAMAIYSTCGFAAASAGSAMVGSILDLAGGESVASWTVAFSVLGTANLLSAGLFIRGTRLVDDRRKAGSENEI